MIYKNVLLYSLGFLLLAPMFAIGQDTQVYTGAMQLGKYKGEAKYDFQMIENDTVINGAFELKRSNLKALLEKEDVSFSIQGAFENNLPNGNWVFRFNEFQTNLKSEVEEYQYVVNVNGIQRTAQGLLKSGKPHEKWIYKVEEIKDSEVQRVAFNSTMEFEQGVPKLSFRIEEEDQELVGRFLRNGIAHDHWTLFSDIEVDEIESWHFDEGVLQSIEIKIGAEKKKIQFNEDSDAPVDTLALGKRYLEILKLKLGKRNQEQIDNSGIIKLLAKNDTYYKGLDSILSKLGNASFAPEFEVHVSKYPLSTIEKKQIEQIIENGKKSREISKDIIADSRLVILRLSDQEMLSYAQVTEEITQKVLDPITQFSSYSDKEVLQYVKREELLSKFWIQGVEEINALESLGITVPNALKSERNVLEILEVLMEQTYNRLDGIEKKIEEKIDTQEKEDEAVVLEKKMVEQHNLLRELSKVNPADAIPDIYYQAIEDLQNASENMLAEYGVIRDMNEKLKFGEGLVNCLTGYNEVGKVVLKLPKQQKEIQKEYTDAVWNPFIQTVMDEVVKKRIVSTYEENLIPYFLKEIEKGLDCNRISEWLVQVSTTYQRMFALRKEDTKKMERRLKSVDNPLTVLELFKVRTPDKKNSEE